MKVKGKQDVMERINVKIEEAMSILRQLKYELRHISPEEFYDYMTGETPTGNIITLEDVLNNDFLMVHEVLEISELKKHNIPIYKQTIVNFYPKVYVAHLKAMEYELAYALSRGDYEWIKRRLYRADEQLNDPYLSQEFAYLREELRPWWHSVVERFLKHLKRYHS